MRLRQGMVGRLAEIHVTDRTRLPFAGKAAFTYKGKAADVKQVG